MTARDDPSLGPADPLLPPPALELDGPAPARAGAAAPGPFLLEGARLAVSGSERDGRHTLWAESTRIAAELVTDAGAAANVVASPFSLRRELLGERGSLLELTLVAITLPLAVVQWRVPPGGRWRGPLGLALVLLPGSREVRYHVHGDGVRCVAAGEDPGTAVELRVHPAPASWQAAEAPGGGLRIRASVTAEGPVTLAVASGGLETASRAMAALPHLVAHEARAEAELAGTERLATVTGIPDVDDAVRWAAFRVRHGLLRGAPGPADAAFWAGLGAVAAGDAEAAADALKALQLGTHPAPWRLGPAVHPQALATLLAGRLTLLTGDPAPALSALRLLPSPEMGSLSALAGPSVRDLWALALGTLADALRWAAPEGEIRALRAAAHAAGGNDRVVRLPMAGQSLAGDGSDVLRWLLTGGDPPAWRAPVGTPLESWALWRGHRPDAAWASWRRLASQGLAAGSVAGRGTWDAAPRVPGPSPEAGILLCALAHGLLGIASDAPSGRVRIAPSLPAHLTAFRARGIRVGEAALDLGYEREGRRFRVRLEPTRGRVPVVAALDLSLFASGVEGAWVDGARAELDAARVGNRIRLGVQLVLDAPRTLEVEAAQARPPGG